MDGDRSASWKGKAVDRSASWKGKAVDRSASWNGKAVDRSWQGKAGLSAECSRPKQAERSRPEQAEARNEGLLPELELRCPCPAKHQSDLKHLFADLHKRPLSTPVTLKKSFKDALLTPAPPVPPRNPPRSSPRAPYKLDPRTIRGRCFRCLGRDHQASRCRDPLRCARCLAVGHKARSCMNRWPMSVYRPMRARPAYLSAFVPLTNDFFARQNRRRNAILVDVVPPANLGHFPQETITNGLANRFGGYPTDFLVARHSERNYVVFLPDWAAFHMNVGHPALWRPWLSASTDSSGQIGYSLRMVDLTGYRCLIAVNHLFDIPENLEITFGDISLLVIIQLERWDRVGVDARGNPPPPHNERSAHHDPDARSTNALRSNSGEDVDRERDSSASNTWISSEIRHRRRRSTPADRICSHDRPYAIIPVSINRSCSRDRPSAVTPMSEPQLPVGELPGREVSVEQLWVLIDKLCRIEHSLIQA
uniref:CCHC-type domain-containing protein n=1 Tax=Ananas comosus var. bracteatus TaxID=296719 RepID=A0A6V7NWB5_ANACO|nr:unnamed protein product [Ananas comosus var. bracteatus]